MCVYVCVHVCVSSHARVCVCVIIAFRCVVRHVVSLWSIPTSKSHYLKLIGNWRSHLVEGGCLAIFTGGTYMHVLTDM